MRLDGIKPDVFNPALGDVNDFLRDNMGLVYHFAKPFVSRFPMRAYDVDDLYSIGTTALWKAYGQFDSDKGVAFSSFAAPFIRNDMLKFLRFANSDKRSDRFVTSLDNVIAVDARGHQLTLDDVTESVVFDDKRAVVSEFVQTVKQRDLTFLNLRLKGYTQKEVADIEGVSQSYVSKRMIAVGKRFARGAWFSPNFRSAKSGVAHA